MLFHVLALVLDLVAAPSCVRGPGGQVACGYKCTSNLDKLACAQTPDGMCVATPNRVVCWDPPPDVRILMAGPRRDELPQPMCMTSVNDAACGYYCVRAGGRVVC